MILLVLIHIRKCYALMDVYYPYKHHTGLGFDGYSRYEDYRDIDHKVAVIIVSADPSFDARAADDTLTFEPDKEKYLSFKVLFFLLNSNRKLSILI